MNENKFGMFIHWGIYSELGYHEQAMARLDIENSEYEKLAQGFDPVKYDPAEWVSLAKNAGMKYICFTAKHHDGFCMWDTKYTDYNIMNTPYGKDVLKMLADECEKQGMLLSIYYSNPDWHHPDAYNDASSHQWKSVNKGKVCREKYLEYIKNQVTELLTGYGKIYTWFWDIPPAMYDPSFNELVRRLQPGIYINNRGYDDGDFSTPERDEGGQIGTKYFEHMTEACDSVGEQSWGYRKNEDYHTVRYLTCAVDRIMALGGSFLLNVGPCADGSLCHMAKDRIKRVGDWYNRMGGCLEGHNKDDYPYEVVKHQCAVNTKNGKTYFHFFEGITSDAVAMKNPKGMPKSVVLVNNGKALEYGIYPLPGTFDGDTGKADICLHIKGIPADELCSEPIVIEIKW